MRLIESNELTVWDIYFRTFAIDNPEMTKADTATLLNIAYQVGSEGGVGVYMARIMLNIDVDLGESNKMDEEVFLAESENKDFSLFPNPAKDEVSIFFTGYEEEEIVVIELYELTGRRTIAKQLTISGGVVSINTSALEAGIYLYKINIASGDSGNGKLVIVK